MEITSTLKLTIKKGLFQKLAKPDEDTWIEIYNLYAKKLNPWVPMDEGVLSQSVLVSSDGLVYPGPYAHYQYIGDVYGPSFPIFDEYGEIVGWRSPKGKKKHPTGKEIQYNKEKHDLATDHWDKAMMEVKGNEFAKEVLQILLARAKK